jgi:hypothetical protein
MYRPNVHRFAYHNAHVYHEYDAAHAFGLTVNGYREWRRAMASRAASAAPSTR